LYGKLEDYRQVHRGEKIRNKLAKDETRAKGEPLMICPIDTLYEGKDERGAGASTENKQWSPHRTGRRVVDRSTIHLLRRAGFWGRKTDRTMVSVTALRKVHRESVSEACGNGGQIFQREEKEVHSVRRTNNAS